MPWEVMMGMCFLILFSVTLWGTAQGWFSRKLLREKVETKETAEDCEPYKQEIEKLKGKIFEQSLELEKKDAQLAEQARQLAELMNAINALTTQLQEAEARNAQLAASLKNALEDLEKTRRQLQECRAKLLAKRIVHEKCHMTPETANLVR